MWKIFSGLWMGWGLGSNDAANLFGPGVASKAIKYRTATILIAIFVIIGAVLEGPKCMSTLGKLAQVSGMNEAVAVLSGAALCVMIMSFLGIPVSTSQAVVGSILGSVSYRMMNIPDCNDFSSFAGLKKIIMCWVATPIGGAIIAFLLFILIDYLLNKFVKNLIVLNNIIKWSLILSGCYGAYSLGANNVANCTAVYVGNEPGMLDAQTAALYGGIAIAVGAITFSKNVMYTVGKKIAVLGPLGALIATLSHSIVIHIFTQIKVPVSSSQAIVGAVIGIGLVKGTSNISFNKIIQIVLGWIFTPIGSGLFTYFLIWATIKAGIQVY